MDMKGGDKMDYKQKLLEFRAKNDLTQSQLANILDVNVNMVFRYEKGISGPTAVNKIRFENKMKEWEENKNVSL